MARLLILGGTAEARALNERLAGRAGLAVVASLAGRTARPVPQPSAVRVGGFGGAEGLADHLRRESFAAMVDATHPYAAAISRNAARASVLAGVPLLALRRPPWRRQAGDLWEEAADAADAAARLGSAPRRVFLALGRQELRAFEAAPQHRYLVRSVEPVAPPLRVPWAEYRLARGPFEFAAERAMLEAHGTEVIVAKNSGGEATRGKMVAARELGIRVLLLRRPALPTVPEAAELGAALRWLDHVLALRGV